MTEAAPDWAVRIPNAGIHPDRRSGLPPPIDPLRLAEAVQNAIEGFLKQVVLAVVGVFIPGLSSFEQLQNWANNNGLGPLLSLLGLNYVGDLAALIQTAVTDANGAAGDWISLLETIGVTSAHDAGAIINAAYADATRVGTDLATLLTRTGQATADGLGIVILGLRDDVNTVAGDMTTLLNAAGVASAQVLGALISSVESDTQGATAAIGALLSDLGVPNIHGVTAIIGTANTNAGTAVDNFNTILSDLGLPDANSLATFIANTNTLAANMSTNFTLLANELGIAIGMPALGQYLTATNANALTAIDNFTTLVGDLAVGDIGGLATYLHNANTAAQTSLNNWTTMFADSLVSDATGLASLITNTNTNLGLLITGAENVDSTISEIIGSLVYGIAGGFSAVGSAIAGVGAFLSPLPFVAVVGNELLTAGSEIAGFATGLSTSLGQLPAALAAVAAINPSSMTAAAGQAGSQLYATNAISQAVSDVIVAQLINNPAWLGSLNALATFPIVNVPQSGSPPVPYTIPVTAQASAIGQIGPVTNYGVGSKFESICYMGSITGTLTSIVFNIYSVDATTGANTLVWTSPNQISLISGSLTKNFCNLDSASYITEAIGQAFNVEMQVLGSGTYNLVGHTHWKTAAGTPPTEIGATRTVGSGSVPAATDIAAPGPTITENVPWFALCTTPGVSEWTPIPWSQTVAGTYTYIIPPIARVAGNKFDCVIIGGGGGGNMYDGFGAAEKGGAASAWTAVTLTYGTDIPLGTTSFTVVVGAGGAGGVVGATVDLGHNGGASSIAVPTYGTISAAGGAGGGSPTIFGQAAPNETFNGATYVGGVQSNGTVGNSPGGGGRVNGAAGAPGAAFITAYQGV